MVNKVRPSPLRSSDGDKCGVNQYFQHVMGATKTVRDKRKKKRTV